MFSHKLVLCVCVLFFIGLEAAPKPEPKPEPKPAPKPGPQWWHGGYPMYGYQSYGYPSYGYPSYGRRPIGQPSMYHTIFFMS